MYEERGLMGSTRESNYKGKLEGKYDRSTRINKEDGQYNSLETHYI